MSALCTLKIIRRQTGHIARQAQSMRYQTTQLKIAAEAAKASSDALINSERAWVLAELKMNSFRPIVDANGNVNTNVGFDLICRNAGPTPAWIYEQSVRVKVTDVVIMSRTNYPTPEMSEVGTSRIVFYGIHPTTNNMEPVTSSGSVSCNGFSGGKNNLHTYVYGYVKYRDAFESHRITWFGYYVEPATMSKLNRTLQRIPNEAYNKNE